MSTPTQYPQAPYLTPVPQYKNGMGISSFVLGVFAAATSWIPVFNFVSLVCAFTGLGLGIGGVVRINHGGANNKALTWIGLGLSILGVVLSVVLTVAWAVALSQP